MLQAAFCRRAPRFLFLSSSSPFSSPFTVRCIRWGSTAAIKRRWAIYSAPKSGKPAGSVDLKDEIPENTGTTSTPIDVLLEILRNTDEFTMKAYCNKTKLLCHTNLLSTDDIQQLERPQLIKLLEYGDIPAEIYKNLDNVEELRAAVRNMMLAIVDKMVARELHGHLVRHNLATFSATRENYTEAVRAWILAPWLPHFRVKRYTGMLHGRHLTEQQLAEMKFFTVPQIERMNESQLADLLAQRNQLTNGSRQELAARLNAFQEFVILRLFSDQHTSQFLKRVYWTKRMNYSTALTCRKRCILFLRHPNYSNEILNIKAPAGRTWKQEDDEALLKAVTHANAYIDQYIPQDIRENYLDYSVWNGGASDVDHDDNDVQDENDDILSLENERYAVDYCGLDRRVNTRAVRTAIPILAFDGDVRLWNFENEIKYERSKLPFWRLVSVICNHHYGLKLSENSCKLRHSRLKSIQVLKMGSVGFVRKEESDEKQFPLAIDTDQQRNRVQAISPLHHVITRELNDLNMNEMPADLPQLFPREIVHAPLNSLHRWLAERKLSTNGPASLLRLKLWMFQEFVALADFGTQPLNDMSASKSRKIQSMRFPYRPQFYKTLAESALNRKKQVVQHQAHSYEPVLPPPQLLQPSLVALNSAVADARLLFARMIGTSNIKKIGEFSFADYNCEELFFAGEDLFDANHKWWTSRKNQRPVTQKTRPHFWNLVSALMLQKYDTKFVAVKCFRVWSNQSDTSKFESKAKMKPAKKPTVKDRRAFKQRTPRERRVRRQPLSADAIKRRHDRQKRPSREYAPNMIAINNSDRQRMSFFDCNTSATSSVSKYDESDREFDGNIWKRLSSDGSNR